MTSRESIYSALFALVQSAAQFKTQSRRFIAWTEIPPESQPAIMQIQKRETPTNVTGMATPWRLEVDLVICVSAIGDMTTSPSIVLNPILDAVTALFAPENFPANNKQTLGGLVYVARISGAIETDEGVLGSQALAIIPIEIITN